MGADVEIQRARYFSDAVAKSGWSETTAAAASLAVHPLDDDPEASPAFAKKVNRLARRTRKDLRRVPEVAAQRSSVAALRAYRDLAATHRETHYMTRYDQVLMAVLDHHEATQRQRQEMARAQPQIAGRGLAPGAGAARGDLSKGVLLATLAVLVVIAMAGAGVFLLLSSDDPEPEVLAAVETTTTTTTTTTSTTTTTTPPPPLRWAVDQCVVLIDLSAALARCDDPDADGRIVGVVDVPADELTTDEVAELQEALTAAGFEPGPVDGFIGPRTLDAAAQANESLALAETASLRATLISLRYAAAEAAASGPPMLPIRFEYAAACDERPYLESADGLLCLDTSSGSAP